MERCDECGFDYEFLEVREPPETFKIHVAGIAELLESHDDAFLRLRPEPSVWSAMEYACHVRDVLLMQRDRILLALVEDTPHFVPMYRDERVENAGYAQEVTRELTQELTVAANLMAKLSERLTEEQLARHCIYGFPEPKERDLRWVFRHTAHEVTHHEMDIQRILSNDRTASQ